MADFYSNENFPLPVVDELRKLGHDVLTIQETGKASQAISDEEVLAFSEREGRILLTLNRKHFIRLHKNKAKHAGILACTFDPNFAALAKRIHEAVQGKSNLEGKLIRINRPQK
ncbi:MAG: DUF5615 family PIN-like protein [Chloroflexi bacterium]|nr:DUF5615 family PIN-like protein [Chloroflexota bacterium]